MTDHKIQLSGIFTPVVTPFSGDTLRVDDLRFNLKKLAKTPIRGYLALGSNGEFRSLTDREHIQVLEAFAEEKADKVIMVGTACESTAQTIAKNKIATEMGFEYVSILTPSYFAKSISDEVMKSYYLRIADASAIPVLLYNAPGFTGGVKISTKLMKELAAHDNIVGIKDSSPQGPAAFLSQLNPEDDFHVLAGSVNFFYPSLHLGAIGGIVSLANSLPEACQVLYEHFLAGKFDEANTLHKQLSRLNSATSGKAGVAGVKAAMDLCGYRGGDPRPPLLPVTDEIRSAIKQVLIQENFLPS